LNDPYLLELLKVLLVQLPEKERGKTTIDKIRPPNMQKIEDSERTNCADKLNWRRA